MQRFPASLKKELLGNFIWVSKNAWKRLQIESPYMSQIIETLEIEDGSNEIIYLIKFEQLIPRLQKYYNFEVIVTFLRLSILEMKLCVSLN